MVWAKFDDCYTDHDKIVEAGHLAELLDMRAIIRCSRLETDGFISRGSLRALSRDIPNVNARVASLLEVGRWSFDAERNGWWIHDFLKFNPSKAQLEDQRAKGRDRAQRSRELNANRGRGSGDPYTGRVGDHLAVEKCETCGDPTPCHCDESLEAGKKRLKLIGEGAS